MKLNQCNHDYYVFVYGKYFIKNLSKFFDSKNNLETESVPFKGYKSRSFRCGLWLIADPALVQFAPFVCGLLYYLLWLYLAPLVLVVTILINNKISLAYKKGYKFDKFTMPSLFNFKKNEN